MKVQFDEKAILTLSTGILAGVGTTLSMVAVPAMLSSSDPLPVWRICYNNGKNIALGSNAVVCISGVWLYWDKKDWSYLVAVGLAAAVVPWTLLVMLPTNDALHAIGDGEKQAKDKHVRKLIEKWGKLQWVRTGLTVGAFIAAVVIISK